ncbi:hypothetical protein [Paenibacillus thiaminolyticus]|uniref:hypothetical protein n=1 Tax=Paenibacillus thiaminolyticus TaxID=49283 RepID=UPI002175DCE4|nr:hypothetical protein [Paenibacillus thiaminolyticus]
MSRRDRFKLAHPEAERAHEAGAVRIASRLGVPGGPVQHGQSPQPQPLPHRRAAPWPGMAVQNHPFVTSGANARRRVRQAGGIRRLQPEDIDARQPRQRFGCLQTQRCGITPPLTISGGMIGIQTDTAAQFQTLHRLVPRSS